MTGKSEKLAGRKPEWKQIMALCTATHPQEAEELCRKAIGREPDSALWRLGLAYALIRQRKHAKALEQARSAARLAPNSPLAYRMIARAHALLGQRRPAIDAAIFALRLSPSPASRKLLHQLRVRFREDPGEEEQTKESPVIQHRIEKDEWNEVSAVRRLLSAADKKPAEATASDDRTDALRLETQLSALFGASIFGKWQNPAEPFEKALAVGSSPWRRFAILATAAVLVLAFGWLLTTGLDRRRQEESNRMAEDLRGYLLVDDIPRVAKLLNELWPPGVEQPPKGSHLDLILRAEATLYSVSDADPARLGRIRAVMNGGSQPDSTNRIVTSAMLLSRMERSGMIAALQETARVEGRDPEAAFLLATALARAGDRDGAEAAFRRADELSPGNLFHLSAEAAFLGRIGKRQEALKRLERMIDENPRSPWTQIARLRQSLLFEEGAGIPDMGMPTTDWPPVALYQLHLLKMVHSRRRGKPQEAAGHLVQALEAVGYQPPFVLDAIDMLQNR